MERVVCLCSPLSPSSDSRRYVKSTFAVKSDDPGSSKMSTILWLRKA